MDTDTQQPLTPVVLHTLLSLVDGEMHGYAIAQQVEERTGGAVKMGPGTLYGSLHRLKEQGLIAECNAPAGDTAERRRYYELTPTGREALETEAARLDAEVSLLRAKKVLR